MDIISYNKIIKFFYHLFTALFLFNLSQINEISQQTKYILYIISIFHLYDTYWFYNYDTNAPI